MTEPRVERGRTGGATLLRRGPSRHAVGIAAALLAVSTAPSVAQGCGVASLIDLCLLAGRPLSAAEQQRLLQEHPAEVASLLELKRAAQGLGLDLVGGRGTLEELSRIRGPKVLHLSEPDHFSTIARLSDEWSSGMWDWVAMWNDGGGYSECH